LEIEKKIMIYRKYLLILVVLTLSLLSIIFYSGERDRLDIYLELSPLLTKIRETDNRFKSLSLSNILTLKSGEEYQNLIYKFQKKSITIGESFGELSLSIKKLFFQKFESTEELRGKYISIQESINSIQKIVEKGSYSNIDVNREVFKILTLISLISIENIDKITEATEILEREALSLESSGEGDALLKFVDESRKVAELSLEAVQIDRELKREDLEKILQEYEENLLSVLRDSDIYSYLFRYVSITLLLLLTFYATVLKNRVDALKLNCKIFQTIADKSFDGVLITDRKRVVTYINREFERLTGYFRKEVIGESSKSLKSKMVPERLSIEINRVLDRGEPWRGEFANIRKDGTVVYEKTVTIPVLWKNRVEALVSIKKNITDEKIRGEKITFLQDSREIEYTSSLQSKEFALSEIVSMISYQWRQPLSSIAIILEELKDRVEKMEFDKDIFESDIRKAERDIKAMGVTLSRFNYFFKIDFEKGVISLEEILDALLKSFHKKFSENRM
jgi:PAS domain S-box-containing protein